MRYSRAARADATMFAIAGLDFRPFAGFQSAIRVYPELVSGQAASSFLEQGGLLLHRRYVGGVDVVDPWPDFRRVVVAGKGVEQLHL